MTGVIQGFPHWEEEADPEDNQSLPKIARKVLLRSVVFWFQHKFPPRGGVAMRYRAKYQIRGEIILIFLRNVKKGFINALRQLAG